jgi:hypothetical protein
LYPLIYVTSDLGNNSFSMFPKNNDVPSAFNTGTIVKHNKKTNE